MDNISLQTVKICSFKINIPANLLYNKPVWCFVVIYFGSGPRCRCFLIAIICKCKILLNMCKTVKNAIKICYSKRQCVSASGGLRLSDPLQGLRPWTLLGDFHVPDPLACAVLKFPLKFPVLWNMLYSKLYDKSTTNRSNGVRH